MTFTWVVLPDIQAPYHDVRAVTGLIDYVKRTKPDGLLCVGDEIDLPSVSRWSSGTAGEYTHSLMKDVTVTNQIMTAFRAALGKNKPFHLSRSNHGDRLANYVRKQAPALWEFVAEDGMLDIPRLVGYDKLDIQFERTPFEFAPNWLLCHGDEGGLSGIAGTTARNLAVQKFGKSVVCGHTHRAGVSSHTTSVKGKVTRTLTGVEVGNVMDLKQASYMRGSANWQQACGIVYVDGRDVNASVAPIVNGRVVMP